MTEPAEELAFLGQALLKPDAGLLTALAADYGLHALGEQLKAVSGSELEMEYNRLFLNPRGTPCPPWESVYGDNPRLLGQPHLSALDWYRRFKVEPAANNEPADHAGLLILFYAQLLREGLFEEAERFRVEHLAWLERFCGCLKLHASLDFYRLVGERTNALTKATFSDSSQR